jgi:C4-dicarboxylate-specific signal transduction histidine kinase
VLASTQAAQRLLRHDAPPAPHDLGDDGPDLPAVRQALALAAAQARRASDVLTRLRRLVQDPTQGAVRQKVDLQTLCEQMLHLLGPELRRRGISASVSGSLPALWADPVMLEQIVHNLLINAMQALEGAATPSPTISVQLQPAPDTAHALLLVRDNGPGFAPDHLARAFEPFFSTRPGGLGLGLPLCETLAQALGGSLQARNLDAQRNGQSGAELALTLPMASAVSGPQPITP